MESPLTLQIFSDFVCPWCYFVTRRVERLRQEYQIAVQWLCFPLHPETPPEGQSLEQLFAGRDMDIPGMLARLEGVAQAENLPFGVRTMTFNSRRAQELDKWAETQGQGEAFHHAAFQAYFGEGRNLHDMAVLRDLAQQVGLDPDQAEQVLLARSFAAAVDQDWQLARTLGISSVPTFVLNSRGLVGAQPYEELERLVVQAGAPRRAHSIQL